MASMEERDLAKLWEADPDVRFFLRQESCLKGWPKPTQMGVVNMPTLGLNHRVMSIVANWYCPTATACRAASVKLIKAEVGHGLACSGG